MNDNKTYQFFPDAEMLRRFYDGTLSEKEMIAFNDALANDELMKEAFAGLNRKEFDVVEGISVSINEKLRHKYGVLPWSMQWKIWLSVFAGVIILTISVALFDFGNGGKENKTVKQDSGKEHQTHPKKDKQIVKEKVPVVHSFYLEEDEKTGHEHETTQNFVSDKRKSENKGENDQKTDISPNEENGLPVEPEEKNGGENKTMAGDKPSTLDPGKKTYRLWIEDVAVVSTQNLADKEAASGDGRENMDVTNPNIGSDLSKRKTNSFNLEDMPQYKGGSEALSAYVKGKIALKSYNLKEASVSTVVEFVVTSKGKVDEIKFQNPLDPVMEKDIREILSALTFSPGKKSGKKGSMYYMMALMFGS